MNEQIQRIFTSLIRIEKQIEEINKLVEDFSETSLRLDKLEERIGNIESDLVHANITEDK